MLLNEFLKEHRKVEELNGKSAEQGRRGLEQDATITELKSAIAEQQKEIKALTTSLKNQAAQIQKVGAQLAAAKPRPRVVSNE